jgi:hypothetical protein
VTTLTATLPFVRSRYISVALSVPSGRGPSRPPAAPVDRLRRMEAVFIGLMALVVLLTGYVALLVLYKLFKAEN